MSRGAPAQKHIREITQFCNYSLQLAIVQLASIRIFLRSTEATA
jgi:hypothetical protein